MNHSDTGSAWMGKLGTDGTFPWFFPGAWTPLTPLTPLPLPVKPSSAQTTPPASRKSFIPYSLVPSPCFSKFADHFALLAHNILMIDEWTITATGYLIPAPTHRSRSTVHDSRFHALPLPAFYSQMATPCSLSFSLPCSLAPCFSNPFSLIPGPCFYPPPPYSRPHPPHPQRPTPPCLFVKL